MEASTHLTTIARTAMLGIAVVAAVYFANGAHSQGYFAEQLADRMIEPFPETNWAQTDRKREFERMFRLYEPAQDWELPGVAEIPMEGRAVSPADER